MRILIFSDIHGNAVGLDAMLADVKDKGIDRMVCLGDAIQGGPQPAQVVQRLRELDCPIVMGNADAWLLSGVETGHESISDDRLKTMNKVRQWSLTQLSDQDRAFIAGFQPTVELTLDTGFTVLAYHGSPKSFDDVILPDIAFDTLTGYLADHNAEVYCGGHTHVQFMRRLGAGPQVHFNPGSVGLAYSHHQPSDNFRLDPWAEYAILDVHHGHFALAFHRVPYDVAALITVYQASGRPYADATIAQYAKR